MPKPSRAAVPPPLFILCPGRSFSSVVCSMLGVHPELYGLPEVNLFCVDTVEELFSYAAGKGMLHMVHGLLRVVAQLHDGEQTEESVEAARDWLEQHGRWPTARMYRYLCQQISPRRCVDKSPPYSRRENMTRLARAFPDAYFLHLGRHPRSAGISTHKALGEKAERRGRLLDPSFVERRWTETHINILEFSRQLAPGQYMYLQGEMLLSEPERFLPQIAEWLGVSASAEAIQAMHHPENSVYACVGPANARGGNNRGFLEDPRLRAGPIRMPSMDGRLDWFPPGEDQEFNAQTREFAAMLGYV